ncbi:MAG: DUF4350 domain-containing protein [Saprospiraceae bacterium]|nr:DUF4350 domain-containing protein [Saprospiraceae bacterium]
MTKKWLLLCMLIIPMVIVAQQIADTAYHPPLPHPEYAPGLGSVVFIDEAHHNFHTKEGRFKPFANLLARDGYRVQSYKDPFKTKELEKGKILVISNALHESNVSRWIVPNPSAFTKEEIIELEQWVSNGGSLFLIADHMPLSGAAKDLAAAFGFEFTNGFALDSNSKGNTYFNLNEKTLVESQLTHGRDSTESIHQVATFTGQAFKIPGDATPVLIFDKNYVNFLPDTAWVFHDQTAKYNVAGWSQGAFKKQGQGKLVVFGEAAMFTAQLAGPNKKQIGMNSPDAPENHQLLLNIIHWLDGRLE